MAKFNLTLVPLKDNGQQLGNPITVNNATSRTAAEAVISAAIQARVNAATTSLADETSIQDEWNA